MMFTIAVGAEKSKFDVLPSEMICTEKCSPPSARLSSVILIEIAIVGPSVNMIGSAFA